MKTNVFLREVNKFKEVEITDSDKPEISNEMLNKWQYIINIIVDVIVNDSLGHKKGDQLLKKSAEILKELTREEDILARQGGDEFAVLLPQTGKEKADNNMYQNKLSESKSTKSKIVHSLLNSLEVKSNETKEHALRMTKLACRKRYSRSNPNNNYYRFL